MDGRVGLTPAENNAADPTFGQNVEHTALRLEREADRDAARRDDQTDVVARGPHLLVARALDELRDAVEDDEDHTEDRAGRSLDDLGRRERGW